MSKNTLTIPRQYKGVMISSTFTDLSSHRSALIKIIDGQDLKPLAMENDAAKPDEDVIDSSLKMVLDSSAYIGVISHRYGQIPECPRRNPGRRSLTELEFNEARRLGRPVLLFIMGDEHDVKPRDVERDPDNFRKLKAFRENAKRLKPDSAVHRVYKVFNSLREFEVAATQSVASLRRYLDTVDLASTAETENNLIQSNEVYDRLQSVRSEECIKSLIKVKQRMKQAGYSLDSEPALCLKDAGNWYRKTFHDADIDSEDWVTRMAIKSYLDQLENWARQLDGGLVNADTLFSVLHDALIIDLDLLRIAIAGHQEAHEENRPYTKIRHLTDAFTEWRVGHDS